MVYSDSRLAAVRLFRKIRFGWVYTSSTFVGNFGMALLFTSFFRELDYGVDANYVFFLTVLAIGLWVTEAIPPFAVGIFIIVGLVFGFGTDFINTETKTPVEMYLGTWTSSVIWLLLGGFFLAEGMNIAGLDRSLFRFAVRKFGTKPDRLLLGLMVTTAFGSMVMSNTATTAMMISSVLPLVHTIGKNSSFAKALLVGIPAAATLGGMGTIIGSTPNAIAVGGLQELGIYITFIEWMIFGIPMALISIYIFWRFLRRKMHLNELGVDLKEMMGDGPVRKKFERNAVIFVLFVTVTMWITEPVHGIPIAATSAIPILLLTVLQVIKAEDVRRLPWDTLMLVAGGLSLGIAMVEVGLTNIIMSKIEALPIPIVGVALVFSLIAVLISNIMSNTAAAAILVPLGLSLPGIWGMAVPLIVALSCSCALLLPVSTPSNAIAFSTGMVEQKSFRPGGLLMILIGPLMAFASVMLYSWIFF